MVVRTKFTVETVQLKLAHELKRLRQRYDFYDPLTVDACCHAIAETCIAPRSRIAFLLTCGVPQENIRANAG